MFKKLFSIILCLCLISLSGCGDVKEKTVVPATQPASKNNLHIVSGQALADFFKVTVDDNLYDIQKSDDETYNIYRTDLVTNTRSLLTGNNVIGFEFGPSGGGLAVTDSNIFVIRNGNARESTDSEMRTAKIEKRDLNGNILNNFLFADDEAISSNSQVAYDGKRLIFPILKYNYSENGKAIDAVTKLVAFEHSGDKLHETLYTFKENETVAIRSVFEDKIVLEIDNYSFAHSDAARRYIAVLDLSDKDIVSEYDMVLHGQYAFYKNKYYLLPTNSFEIEEMDLTSGEKRVIPLSFPDKNYAYAEMHYAVTDNRLILTAHQEAFVYDNYGLNLESVKLDIINLVEEDMYPDICGETESDFIISYGNFEPVKRISKADYWANVPNFTEIVTAEPPAPITASYNINEFVYFDGNVNFTVDIDIPDSWTVKPREKSDGWVKYALDGMDYIFDVYNSQNEKIGAAGYHFYTLESGENDNLMDIYGNITLPNHYNFSVISPENDSEYGFYQAVKNTDFGEAAVTKVYYSPQMCETVGYDISGQHFNKGILTYNRDLKVYFAMEIEDSEITDSELRLIAESVEIK